MRNIVIYDFEVFRYDVLLGTLIVSEDKQEYFQTWNKEEMKKFYYEHINDLFVGHNNLTYDNGIYEAILNDKEDIHKISKSLVNGQFRKKYILDIQTYDVMKNYFSLKMSELSCGKKIHTSDVDFDIDRPLNEKEKLLTEDYNRDDLSQTLFNFLDTKASLLTRLDLINEFGLSKHAINFTEARIASMVLGAKQIEGIDKWYVKPEIYPQLQVKNKEILDFYLSEGFRQGKNIEVNICGCPHKLGAGGIHAALKKAYEPKVMYFDVSGYYNLVMINYDLLPRTLSPEGKELYIHMYHEQLRLKKIDPRKRSVYKTILLAVFGAMMNEYTDLYDPQRGSLVTMTGQMFLVDLLEKLENLGYVVQSNTDGVMFVPFNWNDKEKIWDIIRAWEERTGFVIKKEIKYNLYQRDVNNYVFSVEPNVLEHSENVETREDYVVCRGEAVGSYWVPIEHSTMGRLWEMKEPKVICNGIVDYLIYHIKPEDTVKNFMKDLRYFQYACKKLSYDYMTYEVTKEDGTIIKEDIPNINRAFALSSNNVGMIYKYKDRDGKLSRTKVACLPDSVFVYNEEILSNETVEKLVDKIDWQYYVNRIYERIQEFVSIPIIKDVRL